MRTSESNQTISSNNQRRNLLHTKVYMLARDVQLGNIEKVDMYARIHGYITYENLSREDLVRILEERGNELTTTTRFDMIDAYDFSVGITKWKTLVESKIP